MPQKPEFISPLEYGGDYRQFPGVVQAAGPRVQNGDWLTLTLTTSDATGSVQINGRILTDVGEIVPFTALMTFSGTGTQTAVVARLGGGWLQGFDVHRVSGTLTDGEVIAAVHLGTGELAAARYECCLASGEVTDIRSLGLGAFLAQGTGSGATTQPTIVTATAAPAAGSNFTFTVTAAQVWEIFGVRALLTTSATVATRTYSVMIDDGTNVILRHEAALSQAASLAYGYSSNAVGALWTPITNNVYLVPIPPLMLAAGSRVRSNVTNIQAGDVLSECVILYRQY